MWLSLHGGQSLSVSANDGLCAMGGAVAGSAFSKHTDIRTGNALLPSVQNAGAFPPFGHLVGGARSFAGQRMSDSLEEVSGIGALLQVVADATTREYLLDGVQLLVMALG